MRVDIPSAWIYFWNSPSVSASQTATNTWRKVFLGHQFLAIIICMMFRRSFFSPFKFADALFRLWCEVIRLAVRTDERERFAHIWPVASAALNLCFLCAQIFSATIRWLLNSLSCRITLGRAKIKLSRCHATNWLSCIWKICINNEFFAWQQFSLSIESGSRLTS